MRRETRWLFGVLLIGALAASGGCSGGTAPASGSEALVGGGQRYVLIKLGSLGGTFSFGNSLSEKAAVGGLSALPGDATVHATLWKGNEPMDLGTLGGPNSAVLWPSKNRIDLVAGVAETDQAQPLDETWSCRFFFPSRTAKICLGVVWDHGVIRALPTWGGENGFATTANNLRQIVGWAETPVLDPTCTGRQKRQFLAALWGPGEDEMHLLPPLTGDSTSAATGINDHGQAIGISGACGIAVGGVSARRAVLWENGSIVDLGTLGGEGWNTPMALNALGDVVGFANAPGTPVSSFIPRPFLWTRSGGIEPLPLLDGDDNGQALDINVQKQIVGVSCAGGSCRGVLWENKQVIDLSANTDGLSGTIVNAGGIDDKGRIGGHSFDPATGLTTAFRLIPAGESGERMGHDRRMGDDDLGMGSSEDGP
jgi:probable HAF family extracellular repeat protein